jgi:hypothetical protein
MEICGNPSSGFQKVNNVASLILRNRTFRERFVSHYHTLERNIIVYVYNFIV